MKLSRPFKKEKSELYSGDEETSSGVADWATTSADWKKLSRQSRTEGRRPPELWIPAGEARLVRFVDEEPVCSFRVYKMKHNGKWRSYVAPPEGKTDLFSTALGLRPTRVFLWRVIDLSGYVDKKTKKEIKNQARFLAVTNKYFDVIQMVIEDAGPINSYDVKIRREGTGTNTAYSYIPRPAAPLSIELKKVVANFPNYRDFYSPPSKAQQEAIVSAHGGGDSED